MKFFRYLDIILAYCSQYLKTLLSSRGDFLAQFFSDLVSQVMNLVVILVIFRHISSLSGWSEGEMLFLYGFFLLPNALFNAFFSNLFDVPEKYILQGQLDRILTRPVNSLFQVLVEQLQPESLWGLVSGLAVMGYAAVTIHWQFSWLDPVIGTILVLGATLIYGGIYIFLASLAFWFEGNNALMPTVYNLSVYGRYPVTVYKGLVRFVLTWILPFAFTAFYPASLLLGRAEYFWLGWLTPVVGLITLAFGSAFWFLGVRRYTGAGS
ncbi:MAG TPA: ABC-2 family transporter protein [Bacillota bacterium]|nr:ABC-2 family transporter protein [Bacillota bacterium]